jgi:hypothetical protein
MLVADDGAAAALLDGPSSDRSFGLGDVAAALHAVRVVLLADGTAFGADLNCHVALFLSL